MDKLTSIVSELQRRKGSWEQIAIVTGVPYETLAKIARGVVKNPRFRTVEKLLPLLDRRVWR